jgi:hypothetical protein
LGGGGFNSYCVNYINQQKKLTPTQKEVKPLVLGQFHRKDILGNLLGILLALKLPTA